MEHGFVQRFLDIRIAGRYQLRERLGVGTFGQVYLGCDVNTGNEVAIKLEHYRIAPSRLDQEVEIYECLRGRPGFPQVLWHGSQDDFQVMVFELLGPNLEDLFRYCDNRLSMKTTLMLMDQLLRRLESLHASGHYHRDIKPENFLLGTGKWGNVVYVTDLGLASHRLPTDKRAVWYEATKAPRPSLTGTCRYASINGHMDVGEFRDSILLHHLLTYDEQPRRAETTSNQWGSLPWQGLRAPNRQVKYKRVLEQKQKTGVDELCRGLPAEFATYMNYLRQMRDPDTPDYAYLRNLFDGLFRRLGFEHDHVFDWTIRELERLSNIACQPLLRETGDEGPARAKPRTERSRRGRRRTRRITAPAEK
ncbi:MAG: hypothetical protein Q9173_002013 [Seirophora scorigena]